MRIIPWLLVILSGALALTHQTLWTRRLIDLLGASNESSTRVFACFFLGLALGSAFAAWKAQRARSFWQSAGLAEIGIGLLSLPVIFLPAWTDWIWPAMGPDSLTTLPGACVKLLIAFVAIFPPAFCMGYSFPMIVQAAMADRGSQKLGQEGLWLYGLNTVGGALGILLTLLYMLERWGSFRAMLTAAVLNAVIGSTCLWLASKSKKSEHAPNTPARKVVEIPMRAATLAFISGAATLALEVLGVQMLILVTPSTLHTPGAILFAVILALSLPPLALSWMLRTPKCNAPGILSISLPIAALLVACAPLLFMGVARSGGFSEPTASLSAYIIRLIVLSLLTLGPAWIAIGFIFPSALAWTDQSKHTAPAFRLGILLAINGIGGFLGAELALHWILPTFGVYQAFIFIAALLALSILATPQRSLPIRIAISSTALLALLLIGANWVARLPTINPHLPITVIDEKAGPEGHVAVIEDKQGERSILVSNQYTLGGTSVRYDQERQALLPLILHPNPESIAFIGLATGITPGAAAPLSDIQEITSIELSPLVVRAADRYFSDYNYGITHSERFKVVVEDGRTYIAACENEFDVVAGDLFLPWAPGETRLYSQEHFEAVKRSLKPDGLFCQWLAMYQLTPDQYSSIAATFRSIFPDSILFINHFRGDTPMLALVGWKNPDNARNWRKIARQRSQELAAKGEIFDPVLRHSIGLDMLYLGPCQANDSAPICNLNDLALEFSAARQRVCGDPGQQYFYMNRWFKFCHEKRQASDTLPNAAELAEALQALEAANATKHASLPQIVAYLNQHMPRELRFDQQADWNRWPGSLAPRPPKTNLTQPTK
ncbi:fused MFS/spermidine synthase [Cerasicoccus frondis]|uniref:fused MFS/spermidine synthase n=1 Tax=Cerasicoccus frondis TaxID=490090 RepID=UPI0028528868|nr:fused MFS/spermidine synthase [Cerasicoccus frondis]